MSDIICKRCGNKMIQLLITAVCDTCDPPGGSNQKPKLVWWDNFWFSFIGGTPDPTLSKLNKPLHTSQVGNLTNGKALAVVLFWPTADRDGNSHDAIVFNTKTAQYQHTTLPVPAKEATKMSGFPDGDENDKYIHALEASTPTFGQFSDKWSKMIILMDSPTMTNKPKKP